MTWAIEISGGLSRTWSVFPKTLVSLGWALKCFRYASQLYWKLCICPFAIAPPTYEHFAIFVRRTNFSHKFFQLSSTHNKHPVIHNNTQQASCIHNNTQQASCHPQQHTTSILSSTTTAYPMTPLVTAKECLEAVDVEFTDNTIFYRFMVSIRNLLFLLK